MDDNKSKNTNEETVDEVKVDPQIETPTEEVADSEGEKSAVPNDVDYLVSVEKLINLNIAKLERLKTEIRPVKEMVDSLLDSDLSYAELSEEAKKAAQKKTAKKKEIMNTANGKELNQKLKDMKNEMSDARDALSTYLREYQSKTGQNEFEGEDGELRQIVFVAKLVRKTNLNRE